MNQRTKAFLTEFRDLCHRHGMDFEGGLDGAVCFTDAGLRRMATLYGVADIDVHLSKETAITWDDLKNMIETFTEEQRKQTVTIFVSGVGEYYVPVHDCPLVESDETCDVLDPGHKYLVI